MKSIVVLTLQVLLILVPIASLCDYPETSYGWDEKEERKPVIQWKGDQVTEGFEAIPIKLPQLCWGSYCLDLEGLLRFWKKEDDHREKQDWEKTKLDKRSRLTTCYKNVKIIMTKECSQFQPLDFSNMHINDFCVGSGVQLGGSITIFYPISHPFSITANLTRVKTTKRRESHRSSPAHRHHGKDPNVHVLEADGCTLFEMFLCSRRRSNWCGCPFPSGKAPLFRATAEVTADFIPERLGYGEYVGRALFEFPRGRACMEFAFDRYEGEISF